MDLVLAFIAIVDQGRIELAIMYDRTSRGVTRVSLSVPGIRFDLTITGRISLPSAFGVGQITW